jgi:hypothetical protein
LSTTGAWDEQKTQEETREDNHKAISQADNQKQTAGEAVSRNSQADSQEQTAGEVPPQLPDDIDTATSTTVCKFCGANYNTAKLLGNHVRDRHDESGVVKLKDKAPIHVRREKSESTDDSVFRCHGCQKTFMSLTGFKGHLSKEETCMEVAKINSNIFEGATFSQDNPLTLPKSWTTLREGLIHAEGIQDSQEEMKERALRSAARLGLFPIGISIGGVETSVTVGSGVYDALPDAPFAVAAKKLLPDPKDDIPNTSSTNPVSTPDAMEIIT